MSAPTSSPKRLVVLGATGMVGRHALGFALDDPAVGSVTAIGRRRLEIAHPKLTEVLHRDFADCSSLADALVGQDGAVFCLGAYTGAVSDAELRTITLDYPVEFARVLFGSSPDGRICLWGGAGGSMVIVDVDRRMTLAYVMNKMAPELIPANITALATCFYGIVGG